jgi:hypothetical protein
MKKAMWNRSFETLKWRQQGTALMVAMIVLIGISLLSLAGANTSILELRMARNTEATATTQQTALATIDFIINDDTNLPATGPLYTPVTVALPDDPGVPGELFDTVAGESIDATATRISDCMPPPRARLASSLTSYSAFGYEAAATVDKNATGNGSSGMLQGYILLGPKC